MGWLLLITILGFIIGGPLGDSMKILSGILGIVWLIKHAWQSENF